MAAVCCDAFSIFLFVLLILKAKGQENKTVTDTGSTSSCICDLVVNGCDPNCCCDVDCTFADRETFTECKESKNIIFDDRVCVSDQMIFIKNVPFTTKNTGDGLFCILHNNNKNQDQYSHVDLITNDDDFTSLVQTKNMYSYSIEDKTKNKQLSKSYKVGDKVYLLLSNQTRGYLSLPTSLGSSACNDFNAAGYFQDAVSQCSRSFTDFPTQCLKMSALSGKEYFTGFQVAKTPEAFLHSQTNESFLLSQTNESFLFTPTLSSPLLCREKSGILNQCSFSTPPDPSYNISTKTCENVVTEVSYTLIYSNETTKLEGLNVSLIIENVQWDFVQKYSIRFLKEGVAETFTKSGNPGYLINHPVLAGLLVTDTATKKKAILLSTNKKDWLTMAKASFDGSCSSSVNDRLSVTFNINARSGCMIRLNKSSNCSLLQERVFTALLSINPPVYVASFGNSDVKNVADWVKILNNKPPANRATGSQGVCENMVLGMQVEILFAKIGYLANPEAKIVGARFKYEQAKTITYQCVGQFCQDNAVGSHLIEVVSSVSFIDASQPPTSDQKSLPEFQSKAPSDFFHPFL